MLTFVNKNISKKAIFFGFKTLYRSREKIKRERERKWDTHYLQQDK